MVEIVLEMFICGFAAICLMVVHELSKGIVYKFIQYKADCKRSYMHSIWEVYRYIDPVGVILAITSHVVFSKPYMFRIQDKRTNRIIGFTGFFVIALCFLGSVFAIRCHVFGVEGLYTLNGNGIGPKVITLFLQYIAILSGGMFLTNLFPVSTFDMGLIIAGFSSHKYLNLIKKDGIIKMIYILVVLLDLMNYGVYRLLSVIL